MAHVGDEVIDPSIYMRNDQEILLREIHPNRIFEDGQRYNNNNNANSNILSLFLSKQEIYKSHNVRRRMERYV